MKKSEEILDMILRSMRDRKISKRELAKKIGCTTRHIYYWQNGERSISIDMADKALKALGISYTLGADDERKRKCKDI